MKDKSTAAPLLDETITTKHENSTKKMDESHSILMTDAEE
jgi:hypothetical protein